jgi:hypothetical protein
MLYLEGEENTMGIRTLSSIRVGTITSSAAQPGVPDEVGPTELDAVRYIAEPEQIASFGAVSSADPLAYAEGKINLDELDANGYAMNHFDDGMLEGDEKDFNDREMDEEMESWRGALESHGPVFRFTREQMVHFLKEARQGGPLMKLRGRSEDLIDGLDEAQLKQVFETGILAGLPQLELQRWPSKPPKGFFDIKRIS